jgi:hypothetical protein
MKRHILDLIRRAVGTKQILERLERVEWAVSAESTDKSPAVPVSQSLELLPGTPYARYAIPLDYKPSRALAPRYGYSHGKIEVLAQWFAAHSDEYRQFLEGLRLLSLSHIPISLAPEAPLAPAWLGGAITAFDCLALYAMIHKHAPKSYLEIGSGMTTCFARQAISDGNLGTKVISIDPQPRREVDAICDQVIRDGLETCDLSIFDQLTSGDVLFLDGSHRCFMNSDVTIFFIDILPRLKPGVVVHVHDVLLLWDYPDSFKNWYWNEQYILAVYLMCCKEKLFPLLPTTWITRSPQFSDFFQNPFIDLGSADANQSWKHGGSMWFTKRTV